jgi:hypothetical protein
MKIFEIQASDTTKTIDEALEAAEETGILEVPEKHLMLHVTGGLVEVDK